MKSLVFDAGPVISLTMNNLLWSLEPLRKAYGGNFYIPKAVKSELVDVPLTTKKFEFEALQVMGEIDSGVLEVFDSQKMQENAVFLLNLANNCFSAKGSPINIVHWGEMATLATAIELGAQACVIDERTTRDLIERPNNIAKHMQDHLHTKVSINYSNLDALGRHISKINVIRSVELTAVLFELGLLDRYVDKCTNKTPELRRMLLDSVLWGVKLDGCAVSEKEIREMMKIMLGKV